MAAALTQDVIIELILRYIGGQKLLPSKLDVGGRKVPVQATSLQAIADQLSQYGNNVTDVKSALLNNPKAAAIAQAKSNIAMIRTKINNL
jgi:hypothetical protein